MEKIGFAGLGKMGAAMAPRFLEAGYPVGVWNRTADKAQPLIGGGAELAESPRRLAAGADVIISMLSDDAAVRHVFEGPEGFLYADVQGKLFIEMSTLRPTTVTALAARARARGAGFVDAPVSGTVAPAKAGKLFALVGGSEGDVSRARPFLDVLSRRVVHAGPTGCGAMLKLVVNLPLALYWVSLAEAMAMGRHGGLAPELMLETIQDSSAALAVLPLKAPSILAEEAEAAFDVSNMQKDMLSMLETASRLGVPMPASAAALAEYSAVCAAGLGSADAVAVVRFVMDRMSRKRQTEEFSAERPDAPDDGT
jgi:3-hydroxyisobutyrate dehydrogenase